MRKTRSMSCIGFFALVIIVQLFMAAGISAMKASDIEINGYIGIDMGQFMKARYLSQDVNHIWIGSTYGEIGLKASPTENMTVIIGILARAWVNGFPPELIQNQQFMYDSYQSVLLDQAQGIFSLIKDERFKIEVAAGIMNYKYNPDATNLGEYLFRSGTYPAFIENDFDFPLARLTGVRASLAAKTDAFNFGMDLFALTEMQLRPFHDLSVAAVAHIGLLRNLVDIGGGVEFAHCWAIDSQLTTPVYWGNEYYTDTAHSDSGYYSFAGTKLMGRVAIDPLFFVRENMKEVLGKGGKIYAEMAILGVKNYPASSANKYGYDKLSQKMPIMFGFSLPTWNVLDECSFEFEHFGCNYPLSYNQQIRFGYPLPSRSTAYGDSMIYAHNHWKWSINVKKNITKNFSAVFQLGRDHSRWEANGAFPENADFEDALLKSNQIAWRTKFLFTF